MENPLIAIEIDKWERECLRYILGDCIFNEIEENSEISEGVWKLKDNAPERLTKLLYGDSYEASQTSSGCGCGCHNATCTHHYWNGLYTKVEIPYKGDVKKYKSSLVAYYIYFNWAHTNRSQTTGTGEQVNKVENSKTISNEVKRKNAWNHFVHSVQGCHKNGGVSLYDYLREKESDFPNHSKTCFSYLNLWDI